MTPLTRRTARQLPRWSELAPLVKPSKPVLDPVERRLQRAQTVADLRQIARRRTPRAVFDYTDGAAEDEISIGRARDAYARVEFLPRVLHDVSRVDTSADVLGRRAAMPIVLAPTGFTRLMHHAGETAVAAAAAGAGLPYALSTMGTTSLEALAEAAPDTRRWFQLYLWTDRDASSDLVERAWQCGYDTLVLTVDTPVAGSRRRDVVNGFTIPPSLTLKTMADIARYPAWWANLLTTAPLEFASLSSWNGTVAELIGGMFDPSLDLDDLDWLRGAWPGRLVVKGIQTTDDALRVADRGADGVVLSNHGGRQLDRAPTPLELLPEVRRVLEDRVELLIDTGIMTGADVVAALALGADAVLVGRAYLYGLMAGGERGVARAIEILRTELVRTMQLMGAPAVADLRGRAVLRPA